MIPLFIDEYLGARDDARGITHPLHSPKFDMDEAVLPFGAAMLARIALRFLEGK